MTEPEQQPLHLVVGVDDHPVSLHAVIRAADLAARLGAHLDVLHVVDTAEIAAHSVPAGLGGPPTRDLDGCHGVEAKSELRRRRAATEIDRFAIDWTFHTAVGDPADVLAELAARVDAYCIIVGSRGEGLRPALSRLVHPSVSHALIHSGHRPVLVVSDPTRPLI